MNEAICGHLCLFSFDSFDSLCSFYFSLPLSLLLVGLAKPVLSSVFRQDKNVKIPVTAMSLDPKYGYVKCKSKEMQKKRRDHAKLKQNSSSPGSPSRSRRFEFVPLSLLLLFSLAPLSVHQDKISNIPDQIVNIPVTATRIDPKYGYVK